jgi:hypothetical protein
MVQKSKRYITKERWYSIKKNKTQIFFFDQYIFCLENENQFPNRFEGFINVTK